MSLPPLHPAACRERLLSCANANFMTISLVDKDCSWYAECDLGNLIKVGANYGAGRSGAE